MSYEEALQSKKDEYVEYRKTGIIQQFLAYVKGVEILSSEGYYSAIHLDHLLRSENIDTPSELIDLYVRSLITSKIQDPHYDLSDIEAEVYDAIFLKGFDFESSYESMQTFFDEFKKFLNK